MDLDASGAVFPRVGALATACGGSPPCKRSVTHHDRATQIRPLTKQVRNWRRVRWPDATTHRRCCATGPGCNECEGGVGPDRCQSGVVSCPPVRCGAPCAAFPPPSIAEDGLRRDAHCRRRRHHGPVDVPDRSGRPCPDALVVYQVQSRGARCIARSDAVVYSWCLLLGDREPRLIDWIMVRRLRLVTESNIASLDGPRSGWFRDEMARAAHGLHQIR